MTDSTKLQHWMDVASRLLVTHFGVTLNDTELSDEDTVISLIESDIRPFEAVNDLVDKFDLVRLNSPGFIPRSRYLDAADELIAGMQSGAELALRHRPDDCG